MKIYRPRLEMWHRLGGEQNDDLPPCSGEVLTRVGSGILLQINVEPPPRGSNVMYSHHQLLASSCASGTVVND